jgi:hypothetical protein
LSFPLLRFDPPTWFVPKTLPWSLNRGQLSWVSLPLQRVQTTRVHVLPFNGKAPPQRSEDDCWLSTSRSHPASYGAALRLSQPLSDFSPLAATLPFSDRWHSWGCVLQGFVPFAKPPATRRCKNTLLVFIPQVALPQSQAETPSGTQAAT